MTIVTKEEVNRSLGRIVSAYRRKLGLSQLRLAQAVDLSRTSIANIESGRQALLTAQLFQFASALNTTPSEILAKVEAEFNESVPKDAQSYLQSIRTLLS
jgi:transcriptional regulator with XRE-family HTH domain